MTQWLWRAASVLVAALFVALWQWVADAHLISPGFLPGPDRAWAALLRGFATGVRVAARLAGRHRGRCGDQPAAATAARAGTDAGVPAAVAGLRHHMRVGAFSIC